jgi:hypothetical protein
VHSIMADEVWVQLYIGEDKSGDVFDIDYVPNNVSALKKAVHQANGNSLGHCDARQLDVYKAGTQFPSKEEDKLRPGSIVPKDATDETPLRVLAPGKMIVQPMLNETPGSVMMLMEERTSKILDAWSAAPLQVPNDINTLAHFVKSELPSPLPYMQFYNINSDKPVHDVIDASKKKGDETLLLPALCVLRERILSYFRPGTTEDTLHGVVDDLILAPIKLLSKHVGLSFVTDRNSSDNSGATQKRLRPDVLVWLPSGVLAFKGEEKANHLDIGVATKELSKKLAVFTNAFFGNVQYQLCYAMGGLQLQFCATERRGSGKHGLHCLTDPVDLATIQGRSMCVRYAVNISRLLIAMHRQDPSGNVIRLGASIISESSEVYILGDHIIKKPKMCTGALVLKELYELLKRSRGVDGLIRVFKEAKWTRDHITLYLHPVGTCGKMPVSIKEAKVAGKRVLTALQYLHTNGWVHRDIRPENVMFADQNWYLVDLEWANSAGLPVGEYTPQQQWTPPEILGSDSEWTHTSDMWQFHKLLDQWNHLDEDGRRLLEVLQCEDPQSRISAEVALKHAYFS